MWPQRSKKTFFVNNKLCLSPFGNRLKTCNTAWGSRTTTKHRDVRIATTAGKVSKLDTHARASCWSSPSSRATWRRSRPAKVVGKTTHRFLLLAAEEDSIWFRSLFQVIFSVKSLFMYAHTQLVFLGAPSKHNCQLENRVCSSKSYTLDSQWFFVCVYARSHTHTGFFCVVGSRSKAPLHQKWSHICLFLNISLSLSFFSLQTIVQPRCCLSYTQQMETLLKSTATHILKNISRTKNSMNKTCALEKGLFANNHP